MSIDLNILEKCRSECQGADATETIKKADSLIQKALAKNDNDKNNDNSVIAYMIAKAEQYNVQGEYDLAIISCDEILSSYNSAIKSTKDEKIDALISFTYYIKSISLFYKKDYDGAISSLTKATSIAKHQLYYYQTAIVYSNTEDWNKVILNCTEAIHQEDEANKDEANKQDKNPGFLSLRGRAYIRLGNFKNAFSDFSNALIIDPQDSESHFYCGVIHVVAGDIQKAMESLDTAISLDEDCLEAYHLRASILQSNGADDQAIRDFSQILRLKPDEPMFYASRAASYDRLGEYNLALSDYITAEKLGFRDLVFYANFSLAYYHIGRLNESLTYITKALELDPKDTFCYKVRANTYSAMGQHKLQLEDLNRILEVEQDDEPSYVNRAVAKHNLKDYEGALEDYVKAIELRKDNHTSYLNRGILYRELKRYDEALKDFDMVIKLDTSNLNGYLRRGEVYLDTQKYNLALDSFNKGIEFIAQRQKDINMAMYNATGSIPPHVQLYYNRGLVYMAQKEYQLAKDSFQDVLNILPEFELAKEGVLKATELIG